MSNHFRETLIEKYHSTHYVHFTPKSDEVWAWVLDRISQNFDSILASLSRESRILDVACGVGYLEDYLLRNGFHNIESIDLSEEQIGIAKQKLQEHGLDFTGKVKFATADAFDYLRRSEQFDLVAMFDIIEHFPKEEVGRLLQLSYAALRPGGSLLLRTINADNPFFGRFFFHDFTHETPFTPDSMRQCLAAVGFRIDKIAYEKVNALKTGSIGRTIKGGIRRAGQKILAKFFEIPFAAFAEDLVVIAKK